MLQNPPYAIHNYTTDGDYDNLAKCLQRGDDPNIALEKPWYDGGVAGETPLHIAARYGLYDIFILLCQYNADINFLNAEKQTPLEVAEPSFREQVQNGLAELHLNQRNRQASNISRAKSPAVNLYSASSDGQTNENPSADLPKGWLFARDRRTGRSYYIHLPTRTSQWHRPTPDQTQAVQYSLIKQPSLLTQQEIEEQINYIESSLSQKQYEINLQQQQLKLIAKQLEVQKRLELLKTGQPNWQISYDEIEFQNKIGDGISGEVFKGKWRGTYVAVKTLSRVDPSDPTEVSLFSKVATGLRALQHPSIALFLGACTTPALCFVTEYMDGGCLYNLLHKKKRIPNVAKRLSILKDVVLAMSYLHNGKPPIIHKGLKSMNILLDIKQEHAKICDIGLTQKESRTSILGCAPAFIWMSPEQLNGEELTIKSDVYSFGAIVYELCTGKLPFTGVFEQVKDAVCRGDRPPLKGVSGDKWKALIESCWTSSPERRPDFNMINDRISEIKEK